jgi:hypothetical protein
MLTSRREAWMRAILRTMMGSRGPRMTGGAWELFEFAINTARNAASDEDARALLKTRAAGVSPDAAAAALARLRRGGERGFVRDRAFRTLDAAVGGTPVRPPAGDRAALFAGEANLGRIPMRDAYKHFAQLVPDLVDLAAEIRATADSRGNDRPPGVTELAAIRRKAGRLLGPKAHHSDALVRSNMAGDIVYRYLCALAGKEDLGSPDTPYLSAPNILRSGPDIDPPVAR